MAHPIHKIVGPMLNRRDPRTGKALAPATVDEVTAALMVSDVGYKYTAVVAREWINEARRKNGLQGTSEIKGEMFRSDQELRRQPKTKRVVTPQRLSRLQRIARRITRLFSKH